MKVNAVKTFQKVAKEWDYDLSQREVKEMFKIFEETIVRMAEELEDQEKVNLGCISITKKERDAKQMKNNLKDGEIIDVPAKEVVIIKGKQSLLDKLEKEL